MQNGDLVLDVVLLALQGLLGDALDGHQPLGPLLLGQDYLREGPPRVEGWKWKWGWWLVGE